MDDGLSLQRAGYTLVKVNCELIHFTDRFNMFSTCQICQLAYNINIENMQRKFAVALSLSFVGDWTG